MNLSRATASGKLSRTLLKETLSHFGPVAYVDLHGKPVVVTLRFTSIAQTIGFLSKTTDCSTSEIEQLKSKKLNANASFKQALIGASKNLLTAHEVEDINFGFLTAAECAKYQNVARKQKEGYRNYLSNKRAICVKDLIAKRRAQKTSGKLAQQLQKL